MVADGRMVMCRCSLAGLRWRNEHSSSMPTFPSSRRANATKVVGRGGEPMSANFGLDSTAAIEAPATRDRGIDPNGTRASRPTRIASRKARDHARWWPRASRRDATAGASRVHQSVDGSLQRLSVFFGSSLVGAVRRHLSRRRRRGLGRVPAHRTGRRVATAARDRENQPSALAYAWHAGRRDRRNALYLHRRGEDPKETRASASAAFEAIRRAVRRGTSVSATTFYRNPHEETGCGHPDTVRLHLARANPARSARTRSCNSRRPVGR